MYYRFPTEIITFLKLYWAIIYSDDKTDDTFFHLKPETMYVYLVKDIDNSQIKSLIGISYCLSFSGCLFVFRECQICFINPEKNHKFIVNCIK